MHRETQNECLGVREMPREDACFPSWPRWEKFAQDTPLLLLRSCFCSVLEGFGFHTHRWLENIQFCRNRFPGRVRLWSISCPVLPLLLNTSCIHLKKDQAHSRAKPFRPLPAQCRGLGFGLALQGTPVDHLLDCGLHWNNLEVPLESTSQDQQEDILLRSEPGLDDLK